jgi:hypothetical protein
MAELFSGSSKVTTMYLRAKIYFQTLLVVEVGCRSAKKISKIKKMRPKTMIRFKCAKIGKLKRYGGIIKVSKLVPYLKIYNYRHYRSDVGSRLFTFCNLRNRLENLYHEYKRGLSS